MSKRPTPETDANTDPHLYNFVRAKFARKLERERDEAREDAAKWESSSDAMERAGAEQARRADENREWALKAERERDEARYEAAMWALQRDEARESAAKWEAVALREASINGARICAKEDAK